MNIELNAEGRFLMSTPQQSWRGDKPEIMVVAEFAGQKMIAVTDDAGAFALKYLGFEAGGFRSMGAAKSAAPDFARRVLARMSVMIAD